MPAHEMTIVREEQRKREGTLTGRGPVPYLDIELLYVALERERLVRRISARELLRQAGVDGASTWTRMSRGGAPNADNLVRLLSWLGTTDLQTFMGWVSR